MVRDSSREQTVGSGDSRICVEVCLPFLLGHHIVTREFGESCKIPLVSLLDRHDLAPLGSGWHVGAVSNSFGWKKKGGRSEDLFRRSRSITLRNAPAPWGKIQQGNGRQQGSGSGSRAAKHSC